MEAATSATRSLAGDKAQRIVAAMRDSVARRGVAGATFDTVAREAGVSRGLLHYYFGTKERLLAEVVRRDTDERLAALEEQLSGAATADDVLALLDRALVTLLREQPDAVVVVFEFFTLSRRNEEVATEFAALLRRMTDHVAAVLRAKHEEGVLRLREDPEAVADILFAMADGLAMRMLSEPGRSWRPTVDAARRIVAGLVDDRR
ncbi:TetR/AcrR family transcriptional regulator [Conexibacter sp. SYSU D00693]|uniref:TetR/AcrR family transcriptional regulator n=1 Tax=Conexibacter sp. SYSU D00693 TaxID=2812560 RepID=UPI00196A7CD8|nr:TetR family transcriptional regulator C-terminal domain-containing protein [Conexibacter sp. SYSU D00693]